MVPLDVQTVEERLEDFEVDAESPDRAFDRQWAVSLLERAINNVGQEYKSSGRGDLFEVLKAHMTDDGAGPSYSDAAEILGITPSALRSAAFRLRHRYNAMIRDEVARTLEDPADLEAELRYLLMAVSGSSQPP